MFKKAVVGLDLFPAEKPMMDCLSDLARWGIEELVLVHIQRVGYIEGTGFSLREDYTARLSERADSLKAEGFRVSFQLRDSIDVAGELLDVAAAENADILVVGSRSHNLVHDFFLGSVAKDVLRKASLPVLLERIEPTQEGTGVVCEAVCKQKLTRVLLATDFSDQARRAEEAALNLMNAADQVCFLSVIEPSGRDGRDQEDLKEAKAKLAALRARCAGSTDKINTVAEIDHAADRIVRAAEDMGATLIVIGKHGRDWRPQSIIGGLAESICLKAKRPVLVVPGT